MPQSNRPDLPYQGQADPANESMQQLVSERNSLRSQNDQLWKIIEKQRVIIQNLQKDVAKVTAERDHLRQSTASGASSPDQGHHHHHQHHHHHSKRSAERRPQDGNSAPDQSNIENAEKESELASGFNPNASFSSASSTDNRQQHRNHHHQDPQSPRQHGHSHSRKPRPHVLPLTPSNSEGEFDGGKAELGLDDSPANTSGYYDRNQLSLQPTGDGHGLRDPYEAELQVASTTVRAQNYQESVQTPQTPQRSASNVQNERDPRMLMPQTDPSFSLEDCTGIPRNISGSIVISPHHMPHLPPRSPRRERHNASPEGSDNEDEHHLLHPGPRRKGPSGPLLSPTRARGDHGLEQPTPLSPTFQSFDINGQDGQVMSIPKVSSRQSPTSDADSTQLHLMRSSSTPASPAPTKSTFQGTHSGSRKMAPGQILTIPTNASSQNMNLQDGPSSPTSMNPVNGPVSPIATIIDQDAEKFRVYMNKLGAPSRKGSSHINPNLDDQDHAAALGQAVAMENIQAQVELQNRHTNQHQDTPVNPDSSYSQEEGGVDQSNGQSFLSVENRSRKRNSSLPILDSYPKISTRSTSHHRGEDDAKEPYILQPPKRYDSQPVLDNSSSITRSGSPTPSGNSSVNSLQSGTQQSAGSSRSTAVHQQAFQVFGDNLESLSVLVVGSNIKTSDKSKEILTFMISVGQEVQGKEGVHAHKEADEHWRIEKQYADFANLDSKLRITQSRNVVNNLPKLPDKTLFMTHAPSKADARKVALEQYLQHLTSLHIRDTRDLCEFLSTNVIERGSRKESQEAGWKEGYLTKRGKNFGGWKTRFFVLRGPVLEYFDTKDGHHLGSISLPFAQIGRQQTQDKPDAGDSRDNAVDPNSYRHAFLILEPKKGQTVADAKRNPNSVIRHVLCAETDEERDEWVDALLLHIGKEPLVEQQEGNEREKSGRRMPEIQKVAATPIRELASVKGNEKLLLNQEAYERQQRTVPHSPSAQQLLSQSRGGPIPQSPTTSGGYADDRHPQERKSAEGQSSTNSRNNHNQHCEQDQMQPPWNQPQFQPQQSQHQQHQPPNQLPRNHSTHSLNQSQDDGALKTSPETPAPQLTPAEVAEKKQRSRMTFYWPKKATKDEVIAQEPASGAPAAATHDSSRLRNFLGKGSQSGSNNGAQATNASSQAASVPVRQVFGVSLEQAVDQARVQPGYELPAVVYRCIEYLNAHNAKLEEGIYRLNGSAAVIKGLKDRFNQEGDVQLLAGDDYYDIHAVAGLLKLFLRDLPSSVLTRELHRDFLQVIELPSRPDRVNELTRLVAVLPEVNYTILRALTAHLIEIVENADVNKMTARNVGIVFSPTLGIPAGVFALLMSDFDQIFHTNDGRIMPLENVHPEKRRAADSNGSSESMKA
ncbi:hypothetical protein BGX20_010553 [Mortierella sp. AD010]|nr:hypothetical protein BGX20_010553 [Mortierella sp. AD010]